MGAPQVDFVPTRYRVVVLTRPKQVIDAVQVKLWSITAEVVS
jgi:hypothetical protein